MTQVTKAEYSDVPEEVLKELAKDFEDFDERFFWRVWGNNRDQYELRLRALGFEGLDGVLDLGFGMGQWLVPMARLNKRVSGLELDPKRVATVARLVGLLSLQNVDVRQGRIEAIPYPDASFDAVFSYGVIFLGDYRQAIREAFRVLRPGGKFYYSGPGLGWFLKLLIDEHNKGVGYDPRTIAASAVANSIAYHAGAPAVVGEQLLITPPLAKRYLEEAGFADVTFGPEGSLAPRPGFAVRSFYPDVSYLSHDLVYEVLCRKP